MDGTKHPEEVPPKLAGRLARGLGPVAAGMVIDVVDFVTLGPIGLLAGFVIGGAAGAYLAQVLGFPRRVALIIAAGCGLYCMFPPTAWFPLATLVGAMARALVPSSAVAEQELLPDSEAEGESRP